MWSTQVYIVLICAAGTRGREQPGEERPAEDDVLERRVRRPFVPDGTRREGVQHDVGVRHRERLRVWRAHGLRGRRRRGGLQQGPRLDQRHRLHARAVRPSVQVGRARGDAARVVRQLDGSADSQRGRLHGVAGLRHLAHPHPGRRSVGPPAAVDDEQGGGRDGHHAARPLLPRRRRGRHRADHQRHEAQALHRLARPLDEDAQGARRALAVSRRRTRRHVSRAHLARVLPRMVSRDSRAADARQRDDGDGASEIRTQVGGTERAQHGRRRPLLHVRRRPHVATGSRQSHDLPPVAVHPIVPRSRDARLISGSRRSEDGAEVGEQGETQEATSGYGGERHDHDLLVYAAAPAYDTPKTGVGTAANRLVY